MSKPNVDPTKTSSLDKSSSEENISQLVLKTPPDYLFLGNKRPREDDFGGNFSDFKKEVISMMENLMANQEKELKSIFTPALTDIKKSNENIVSSIALLATQNEELTRKIEQLELKSRKDQEYITVLENKMEDMQRSQRKSNIEIKNVPKTATETKEDLVNMVVNLGRTINCSVTKSDVTDIYRVRGKKEGQTNTPIVVELSSTILKTDVLKMSKAFNIKYKTKLRAKHLGLTKNEETPVYVAEQLTTKASRLFFLARDLSKSKGFKFCWTSYGRVYVRKTENSAIVTITNESQINSLMQTA